MTTNEQGRFCGSCEKTVVDFTNWSDTALYDFFKNYQGSVCGRFHATQLHKELHIPYQPKSRLYRIAIACGLTLMFAQVPAAYAGVKQQTELFAEYEDGGDEKQEGQKGKGTINGRVLDENGDPIASAIVEVTVRGMKKLHTVSDINGNYSLANLTPGKYEVSAKFAKKKATLINIVITKEQETNVDISVALGLPAPPEILMGAPMPQPPTMKGDVQMVEPPTPPPPPVIEKGKVKVK
jgi:hypothetical protein